MHLGLAVRRSRMHAMPSPFPWCVLRPAPRPACPALSLTVAAVLRALQRRGGGAHRRDDVGLPAVARLGGRRAALRLALRPRQMRAARRARAALPQGDPRQRIRGGRRAAVSPRLLSRGGRQHARVANVHGHFGG
eukprot:6199350-Pleurochrysis_carterae.AAC.4